MVKIRNVLLGVCWWILAIFCSTYRRVLSRYFVGRLNCELSRYFVIWPEVNLVSFCAKRNSVNYLLILPGVPLWIHAVIFCWRLVSNFLDKFLEIPRRSLLIFLGGFMVICLDDFSGIWMAVMSSCLRRRTINNVDILSRVSRYFRWKICLKCPFFSSLLQLANLKR
jgi:hypothetical protein